MSTSAVTDDREWLYLLTLLPGELEETAEQDRAIVRKRKIKSAEDLLRIILLYCFCGLSLSDISVWWTEFGFGQLTKRAIEQRLKRSKTWISRLLGQKLAEQVDKLSLGITGFRVRIVDATVVNRPGSQGTDKRLHLGLDLSEIKVDEIHLTDDKGGESFTNFNIKAGEILIGDRGYAHREGIAHVVKNKGDVIVRLPWNTVPLQYPDGSPFNVFEALRKLKLGQVGDYPVKTVATKTVESIEGRFIAIEKTPQAAQEAREKIRREARKRGKTPNERTLEAAGYIFVFTSLSQEQIKAEQVLELYRLRWQIELVFKRLKGILEIDEIPVKDEDICQTFLLAKLLGALLVEELTGKVQAFSPWGYGLPREIIAYTNIPARK